MSRLQAVAGAFAAVLALLAPASSNASEGGASFYLLGGRGPEAGILPPPGIFVENDLYFYGGGFGGSRAVLNGNVAADINVKLLGNFTTLLVVAPWEIAGGNIGFSIAIPIGGPWVDATVQVTGGGGGSVSRSTSDSRFTLGDLVFGASMGWHVDKFHWSANFTMNTPTGDYHYGALANIAFHRWAFDFTGAMTWNDPQLG